MIAICVVGGAALALLAGIVVDAKVRREEYKRRQSRFNDWDCR